MPSPTSFFFNRATTTGIYTLSLHDALPIYVSTVCWTISASQIPNPPRDLTSRWRWDDRQSSKGSVLPSACARRSEEHTSELQSHVNLVCRLLLEKKNNKKTKDLHDEKTF